MSGSSGAGKGYSQERRVHMKIRRGEVNSYEVLYRR